MGQMDDIFAPVQIAGITFQNRMLRAATHEGMADEQGRPTESLIKLYERLAKGEVGGIITGYIGVSAEAKTTFPGMTMLHQDENISSFQAMTDRVHQAGCPIIAQIAHCGRHGVAGSKGKVSSFSDEEIRKVIDDFVMAGIRSQKSGFDGVEIHCAHGYLLSEFLSPKTNKRKDNWGGTPENRFSILLEIVKGIKKALPDYPVFVKLNGQERGGIQTADACAYALMCEKAGVNAIEVSCGLFDDFFMVTRGEVPYDMICHDYPIMKDMPKVIQTMAKPVVKAKLKSPEPLRMYNVDVAVAIKAQVNIPVIAVGGIHDLSEIRRALFAGLEAVSICRPLVLEPTLIQKFKQGKQTEAKCINCNHCLIGISQRPLRCYYGRIPNGD